MVEFFIPSKSKVISSIKRHAFRVLAFDPAAAVTPEIVEEMIWVPRLGTVTPLEFDMSYGISGSIITNRQEWYLTLVDVDNLPNVLGASGRAIWSALQTWIVSSAVGITQTMNREIQDFFNPASFNFAERADFTQRLALVLLNVSSEADQTSHVAGVITYQEDLVQRVFGNDNATYETDDGRWENEMADEEDEDND